ncbi:MAG TPA: extracellular solute-binding protein [Chloroflexota bacterium]|nr:extracellular solute-binding protein [Chloroflexota bacterium]
MAAVLRAWPVVLALMLAACGSGAAPAASLSAPTGWQQVVDAARKEGQVGMITQGGNDVANGLTDTFQKAYPDIHVDITAGNGSDVSAKLLTERAAGRFTTDLVVHGTTTITSSLMPAGAVDPIAPYQVGPDDQDGSVWLGGKFNFADSTNQYDLIFTGGVHMPLIYNPSEVSSGEIHSFRDLLAPKWKGKIAMYDPRGAGSGLSMMTLLYRSPTLGKDFIQQLLAQNVTFTKDDRQLSDWIGRGTTPSVWLSRTSPRWS